MQATLFIVFALKVGFLSTAAGDVDVKSGGNQIEYENQDPRVHAMYVDELRKRGIASNMAKYFGPSA